jgi:catechol 2,3-dioxygenase-like lactoylglutathione lyase family enzyme
MARLRHFAVCVSDLDKAATFYQTVFDLKRIGREDLDIGSAVYMSDGVINLALLNFKGSAGSEASDLKNPGGFVGAHHFRLSGRRSCRNPEAHRSQWRKILFRPRRRTSRQF